MIENTVNVRLRVLKAKDKNSQYTQTDSRENSLSCVHVPYRTLDLVLSCCCFAEDAKKCTKFKTHVQGDCFSSLNLSFSDVVVAVAVLVA